MIKNKKVIALFIISICGFLFSGYMSGIKFFTNSCAFNETCPTFLGYPACYYGFIMFAFLLIFSFGTCFNLISIKKGILKILSFSILGTLFAGYFTFKEIPLLFSKGLGAYVLGLPTCALGLVFFLLILIVALRVYRTVAKK